MTKANDGPRVTVATTLLIRILDSLTNAGIDVDPQNCSETSIGILKHLERAHQFLWFRWTTRPRMIVAKIWLDWEYLHAVPNKNWVIEVFGRDQVEEMKDRAGKLSAEFNVSVHVILKEVEPRRWIRYAYSFAE